ncbi:Chromate transporter [Ignisphaera aggregans DSM 17230]|uniref:Chromate transporter n=1 Tax=Ignisphaera aggregans (strain DSM 17230 / JCM 13409 / AQ1.S1) TaxID=583356 RepID=E0SS55_IGNAA|nr:Chromate transporter [Ignisphaera aggregans DSM 17230]
MYGYVYTLITLFITFLKIGAFVFGGGYAMIPVIRHEVVDRYGWLSEEEFLDLIAIAESTPGPIAINAATYVGYRVGGIAGAILATLGVVIPPFTVIILIATALQRFYTHPIVRALLNGIRGAVIGLVTSALITVITGVFKGLNNIQTIATIAIAVTVFIAVTIFKHDPIVMIAISAIIGVALGVARIW